MKERKTDHWKNSKFQRLSKPMRLQSKDNVIICYVMLCYPVMYFDLMLI